MLRAWADGGYSNSRQWLQYQPAATWSQIIGVQLIQTDGRTGSGSWLCNLGVVDAVLFCKTQLAGQAVACTIRMRLGSHSNFAMSSDNVCLTLTNITTVAVTWRVQ